MAVSSYHNIRGPDNLIFNYTCLSVIVGECSVTALSPSGCITRDSNWLASVTQTHARLAEVVD